MRRERGIALIQVLLVAGILGLLMLQMGLTAREQVARAQAIADRAEIQLAAHSRETALLFSLLTETWARNPESANPYVAAWNFRGEPFEVDGARWNLQDESGLMQVPQAANAEFQQLLLRLGVDPERARRLGDQLRRRQDVNLGRASGAGAEAFPLQVLDELATLPDMDAALYRRLRPLLTLYPTPGFNPLTAPETLVTARLSESQGAGVLDARRSERLDTTTLWKLSGITADDSTVLAPGPGFMVRLETGLRESRVQRTTTFIVRPYQQEPLAVWQRSKAEEPEGT